MIKIKGGIAAPKDFMAAATNCGIKRRKKDLAVIASSVPAVACGMFTQNRVKAAPLVAAMRKLKKNNGRVAGIWVNSGNANCFTGRKGIADAQAASSRIARLLKASPEGILPSSTGIIGKRLPVKKILAAARKAIRAEKEGN